MNNNNQSEYLFLDRDGVINIEKYKDYIHTWDEFVFYDGAIHTIAEAGKFFKRIIIVTNQKGVGKGITKPGNLAIIHQNMIKAIEDAGGKIDAVYFCPDLEDESPNRKPNIGMALQAKTDFPEIEFEKSLMIGNNLSDMIFGKNAGMKTAFLKTTLPDLDVPETLADFVWNDINDLKELMTNSLPSPGL
ncbi:D-glycero-alpha-D-manno-heptose-1,7-bisphosphate 7-phosphatase [Polluticaenibacter yanchengensis]|uniref:D,D-heptose 1,7-bisphosphate phosphatase n=1 Tax=Polluticaenibacter yanchengensis TaxID=3014562 RepID=A0ABT4UGG4_9BACT|nr:HAD-IIIA family hydrolase [Chitinophagaceae bacterium LY-5]